MKNSLIIFKSVALTSTLIISLFIIFGFSNQPVDNNLKSYMMIEVKENFNFPLVGMFSYAITITEDKKVRNIVFLEEETKAKTIKKYKEAGFEIIVKFKDFDNSETLKFINEYVRKGWKIHSQSMALGVGTGGDGYINTEQNAKSTLYVLEK